MNRLALLLSAAAVLAAPATASAAERPEWTDCKLTSVPKRVSMQKAFTTGIPVSFVCSRDVKAFVPARVDDREVEKEIDDKRYSSIVDTDFMDVKAGERQTIKMRVLKGWPRQVMRKYPKVRLIVDIAADRGEGMFSHSKYGRHVTLVR